jgi:uncharacterized damage-inducible protein DinB
MHAFTQELTPSDDPDVAALQACWRGIHAATHAIVSQLDEADVRSQRGGTFPCNNADVSQPIWAILLRAANHNTQLRSEAAAMLTEAGCSPAHVDLMGYLLGWLCSTPSTAVTA